MKLFRYHSLATVAMVMLLICVPLNRVLAAEVHAAVAANFTSTMATLIPLFEASTGHRVITSYGSSGTFYAQIKNGAPFEVFLSADVERPRRLVEEGNAIPESRFTYAMGKLVL
jgi:molybdate transport system substrate-binding protein